MDGLFTLDGTPQMPYWVLDAYAQLTGERLAANSSGTNVSALATRNDTTSQVQVLVGRHDDCGPPPRAWVGAGPPNNSCPAFQPPQDAPVALSVSVKEPYALSSVRVTAAPLPNSAMQPDGSDPVPSPPPAFSTTLPVVNGTVTVPWSSMGDGDALMLTLAPAA
jgi:hypothetical protein